MIYVGRRETGFFPNDNTESIDPYFNEIEKMQFCATLRKNSVSPKNRGWRGKKHWNFRHFNVFQIEPN